MKGKLLIVLICFTFLSCSSAYDRIRIYVRNNTMDNIEINFVGGTHVGPGEQYHVITLFRDLPTGSFKVCRGYGCLATVTILAEFPLPEENASNAYTDEFILNEDPRDTFDAEWGGASYIKSVTVTPLNY